MYNELVFILQTSIIGSTTLAALAFGQSALVAWISVQAILANVFVLKQTTLFGLTATCSDAFMIGSILGLNLIREYYGKKATQQTIWISFGCLVAYTMLSRIHLWFLPAVDDTTHEAFSILLGSMPRITIASLSVYFLVQHIDAWLYGYLKTHWNTRYLVMRNYVSLALSQLIDTVLFSFLGLYGIVGNIGSIIIVSYAIKVVVICIVTPYVVLVSRRLIRI